jgi:signal transduction histidine kinase
VRTSLITDSVKAVTKAAASGPEEEAPARAGIVSVVALAVAFAFVLLVLPASRRDPRELAIAAALAVAVVGLSLLWRSAPALVRLGVPLGYIAVVALLVDGGGGNTSGFGGLFLLPVIWLAILGSPVELLAGLVAVGIARTVPLLAVGAPDYPSSGWRGAIVLGAVAVFACVTIQRLVGDARVRVAEMRSRGENLEDVGRALTDQNEHLRDLDRMKDELVALVSHELRTPLTSIIGYLEMVIDDGTETLTPNQQTYLATVSRNVERLTTLVNDLLFLVKADSGGLQLEPAETNLNQLLVEATEAARPAAERKQIDLALETDQLVPIVCDRARIAQLIDNLLANAIKFTPEGGHVRLRAAHLDNAIEISVKDTGIGIPVDELPQLFSRFFRASNAASSSTPGTGLGLAISQAIAEAHNSVITVQSTIGHGTTFRLHLPARNGSRDRSRNLGGQDVSHKLAETATV